MDEKEVYKYFKESPAVTLYATCCFTKEQPDLKDDFLGKCREYYYKAYNYTGQPHQNFINYLTC
ncbi:MAG: hypothetical protein J6K31_10575 [Parabacteroides sp.]|nr:hypothetical protein [Parabacteroides sp.]